MSSSALRATVAWLDSLEHPDAFLVLRHGSIVAERYWAPTTAQTLHDMASATKSIGSIALAHAIERGVFAPTTNLSQFFPRLLHVPAGGGPLQVRHLAAMAGGLNVSYWQQRIATLPGGRAWVEGLRQGPHGRGPDVGLLNESREASAQL